MEKIDLGKLGIRAGSVEADLAMKINELVDELQTKAEKNYQTSELGQPQGIAEQSGATPSQ